MDSRTRDEIVELYGAFFRGVYAYCAYRLYRSDLAEDAVAAVFLRLVEKYETVRDRGRDGIRKWLYGTASNVAAKHLREARKQKLIAEALRQDATGWRHDERPTEFGLEWPAVYRALGELAAVDQALVALRYFSGLESPEIAEILGMTAGAVRVRLLRAIRALRQKLGVGND